MHTPPLLTKVLITSFVSIVTACSGAFAADAVTPLALKEMQSRKFQKTLPELMAGVGTYCEDNGFRSISMPAQVTQDNVTRHPGLAKYVGQSVIIKVTCITTPNGGYNIFTGKFDDRNAFSQLEAELVRAHEGTTTIRIRLRKGHGMAKEDRVDDPAVYSVMFKQIADALFVQDIAIDAAEQE